MKLRKEFITHDTGSDSLLVPAGGAGFSGLVKGNKTFGSILKILKKDVTEEQLIAEMMKMYDAPEEKITGDVRKAVSELRRIGALEN